MNIFIFEGLLHGASIQCMINLTNMKLWGQSWTKVSLMTFKTHGDYLNAWRCLLWVDMCNTDSPQCPWRLIRPLNAVPFSRCKNKYFFFTQTDFSKGEKGSSPLFPQSGSNTRLQALAENTHPSYLNYITMQNITWKSVKRTRLL